jgi:hypothetical protein
MNRCREALWVILDAVDYTKGACRPNEMIGAILPVTIIDAARSAINTKTSQIKSAPILELLCDIKTLLLDVDTPTREQRSDIVHRIAAVGEQI